MDILFTVNPVPIAKKEHYIEFGRSFVAGGRRRQYFLRVKKMRSLVLIAEKKFFSAIRSIEVFILKDLIKLTVSPQKFLSETPKKYTNQVLTHQTRIIYDLFSR